MSAAAALTMATDGPKEPEGPDNASRDTSQASTPVAPSPGPSDATPKPPSQSTSSHFASPKRSHTAPVSSAPTSLAPSPKNSRETSPVRPSALKLQQQQQQQQQAPTPRLSRSRKGSQELSPHRLPNASTTTNLPETPSAAAIQRALSATGAPRLGNPPVAEASGDAQRQPQKQAARAKNPGVNTGRLRSPPRSNPSAQPAAFTSLATETQPPPASTPSIIVNQPTPKSAASAEDSQGPAREEEEPMLRSGLRSPGRPPGTLEAVQESSLPETPAIAGAGGKIGQGGKRPVGKRPATIAENMEDAPSSAATTTSAPRTGASGVSMASAMGGASGGIASTESGSDSGKDRAKEGRRASVSASAAPPVAPPAAPSASKPPPPSINPRRSFSQLSTSKNKIASEGSRNMTVDTETVTTVPQNVVGGGNTDRISSGAGRTGDGAAGGSVKLKPSSETIRPKKEKKKKVVRKAPSMSTTGNSKADIFEAKVASAVDEANSSDSEETFVYESNPPEPLSRPATHRYHSRTPSATSMASQIIDPHGARYDAKGHNSIVGKKSMKFANAHGTLNGYAGDGESAAPPPPANGAGPGTMRVNSSGTALHHHHIGRHGRAPHPTVLDPDALFAADRGSHSSPRHASGPRSATSSKTRLSSYPHSPRTPGYLRIPGSAKSTGGLPYELEADDERTPLLPPARSPRARYARRAAHGPGPWRGGGGSPPDRYRDPRKWRGACACAALGATVALLAAALVVALIFCSKPLLDVHVHDIRNVLAADREIIFDLNVHARNPNLVSIQVSDADLLVHAKSKYVGTSKFWREHGGAPASLPPPAAPRPRGTGAHAAGNVDEGTDPIDDADPHVMLLGQIGEFDAPLIFEASPVLHHEAASVGEVRLARPGNTTESGGSDRWETVIQHPFELIVRGTVRYQIPISSRVRKASVKGSVMVFPDEEEGGRDGDDNGDEDEDGESGRKGKKGGKRNDEEVGAWRWRGRRLELAFKA